MNKYLQTEPAPEGWYWVFSARFGWSPEIGKIIYTETKTWLEIGDYDTFDWDEEYDPGTFIIGPIETPNPNEYL